MAYFPQISNALGDDDENKLRTSDVLAPQAPATPGQAPGGQQMTSTPSNTLGGGRSSGGGGSTTARMPAANRTNFYDPTAYYKQNQGMMGNMGIADATVDQAKKATEGLAKQSADYVAARPTLPTVGDAEVDAAVSGDEAAAKAVGDTLYKVPEPVKEFVPTYDKIDDVKALQDFGGLSNRLTELRSGKGTEYTKGMSDFDAAMYGRTDAYQDEVRKAQGAVDAFNANLDAEKKKYEGSAYGEQLKALQEKIRGSLANKAAGIKGDVESAYQAGEANVGAEYGAGLDREKLRFNTLADVQKRKIKARLEHLDALLKDNVGNTNFPEKERIMVEANDLQGKLKGLAKADWKGFTNKGAAPILDRSNFTTQEQADKFARINSLLGEGDRLGTSAIDQSGAPALDENAARDYLEGKYGVGNDKYDFTPSNPDTVMPPNVSNNRPGTVKEKFAKAIPKVVDKGVKAGNKAGGKVAKEVKKAGGKVAAAAKKIVGGKPKW